ncbi:MAG: SAM-dependent chlorinase/fluorinase [Phycisphaerae bacterium]
MQPITLITDFGSRDHYAGAMKGVILSTASKATIVDITHEIGAHEIVHGAFVLRQTIDWFPVGTVHVAVVDPGVGSRRRILAGRYNGRIVIAPDNGLITLVHRDMRLEEIYSVENTRYFPGPVSATFHGRDIMAPVAAHVASGVALSQLGPPAGRIELLQLPEPERLEPVGLCGSVLYVDHFGNLVTNINTDRLAHTYRHKTEIEVYVGEVSIGPVRATYSDVNLHEPLAMVGSSNMLEIAVNCGRADERFDARAGTFVSLRARAP